MNDFVFALDDNESFKEVIYSDWNIINGYYAKLCGAGLGAALANPNVEFVEEDSIYQLHVSYPPVQSATMY